MHTVLNRQITNAFASELLPVGEPVAVETYDDEGTSEHFQGTRWQDHSFTELERLTPCLSFFTAVAFCFFLPSYLLAALEQPTSWFAAEVASRLCPAKNDPSRASYSAWWSRLTEEQRAAIIAFLKFMQSEYGAVPEADISRLEAHRVNLPSS